MKKHPMAGKAVKLTQGRYKGMIFNVIDYVVNQFQGKQIQKIVKGHPNLFEGMRGPINDNVVIGTLHGQYENHVLRRVVVEENDLMKDMLKIVDGGQDAAPVIPFRPEEVQDVTSGPDSSDNQVDVPGEPEPDGRSVPSGEVHGENVISLADRKEASGPTGSGDSGPAPEHPRPSSEESRSGSQPQGGKGQNNGKRRNR